MTTILFNTLLSIMSLFKHLWLSISSVKFYTETFKNRDSYGIQYIINLSFISSVVCIIFFLYKVEELQEYFRDNIILNKMENVEFILKQIPPMEYDGQKILLSYDDKPVTIRDRTGSNVLIIDPNHTVHFNDKVRFPLVLERDKIIFKLINSNNEIKNTLSIQLNQVLKQTPRIITYEEIKSIFAKICDQAPRILIYVIFPLTGILIFLNTLLDKAFFIITMFLVTRISGVNFPIKTCIRLTMYTSGCYALFQFIFMLVANKYLSIVWIIQSWSSILMMLGVLRAIKKTS